MAIAKMSKLKLIGLKSERNKILNVLSRSHAFEVIPTSDMGDLKRGGNVSHLNRVTAKQAKVAFGINFINVLSTDMHDVLDKNAKDIKKDSTVEIIEYDFKEPKSPMGRAIIGYDDFYDVAAKEYELITICDEMEKISFERLEIKSKLAKLETVKNNIIPYKSSPLKFSQIKDSKHAFVLLASGGEKEVDFGGIDLFLEKYSSQSGNLLGIVGGLESKEKVQQILSESGFSVCPYRFDSTAQEMLDDNEAEEKQLKVRALEILKQGLTYARYLEELKILYDVLGQEIENSTAELEFIKTRDAFVIEGWVPTNFSEVLLGKVKDKTDKIVYSLTEPQEGEIPPTLLKNVKVIKPYEDVTNMYSVPAYNELDPNPFMAIFFFIFFGIMIGDAGYGIILSIACGLALKFLKLEKGMSKMLALVCMGGVSAIVWGIVFGGLFSIQGIPPLWFNPMEEPILMLVLSIVLGIVQLLVGYALLAVKNIRNKKPLDAIFDSIFIYFLFAGIACLALSLVLKPANSLLTYVGLGLLGFALIGILCTAGRHKKGIFAKIIGGFSGLYGLVNVMSDVLSYARLFGLALASGAIGYAFNTLAGLIIAMPIPVLNWVLGIILLIPLHAFNLGIGLLGAYVHNARLQFLEFYGKFYDGGGNMFSPMGINTKYVRFE